MSGGHYGCADGYGASAPGYRHTDQMQFHISSIAGYDLKVIGHIGGFVKTNNIFAKNDVVLSKMPDCRAKTRHGDQS